MKKTFLSLLTIVYITTYTDAQTTTTAYQVIMSYGRSPCGAGGSFCRVEAATINLSQERAMGASQEMPPLLYLDQNNHANFRIPKNSLDSDKTLREFQGKSAVFLEEDLPIDTAQNKQLPSNLVLEGGWHPIIELEDCFIISYTLKK